MRDATRPTFVRASLPLPARTTRSVRILGHGRGLELAAVGLGGMTS